VTERWLPVVGYEEFFEVSNLGRVRSLSREYVRSDGVRRQNKGQVLRPFDCVDGRQMTLNVGGKQFTYGVLQLVLTAFVGPCPPGMTGYHKEDLFDDALENLEWRAPVWRGPSRVGRRNRRCHLRLTLAGWWAAERKDEAPILPEEPRTPEPGWHITPAGLSALATSKHEPPPAA
jgi:hypothetical protein